MLAIPENFEIFFTQGGPQMQQAAVCYNLLGKHKTVNCLITGGDSLTAMQEMSKFCKVNIVADAMKD